MNSYCKEYRIHKHIKENIPFFQWENDDGIKGTKFFFIPDSSISALEAFKYCLRESRFHRYQQLGKHNRKSI